MHTAHAQTAHGLVDIGRPVGATKMWYPAFNHAGTLSCTLIGQSGSGVTHLATLIALGLRAAMPTITVMLGPHVYEALPELAGNSTRVATTAGHIAAVREDVRQLVRMRERRGRALRGDPRRSELPYVLILAHDPRQVFSPGNASAWYDLLRAGRKQRVALLTVGDNLDLADFGDHAGLRHLPSTHIGLRSDVHPPDFGADADLHRLPPGFAFVRTALDRAWSFYKVPAAEHLDQLLASHPDAATNEL